MLIYNIKKEMEVEKNGKKKCELCKKTLVPIGGSRANGAQHKDWEKRKYHKSCFKKIESHKEMMRLLKLFN